VSRAHPVRECGYLPEFARFSRPQREAAIRAGSSPSPTFSVLGYKRRVSVTRPPRRSVASESELEQIDDLEELGDDAIIAQQTAAHAPQPRANVSEESRSVVIRDAPPRHEPERPHPAPTPPRSSAEATLVTRDRRAFDELRSTLLLRKKAKQTKARRALYLWGVLGLTAFLLGGIVAFMATDSSSGPQPEGQPAAAGNAPQIALLGAKSWSSKSTAVLNAAADARRPDSGRPVTLDALPVEAQPKQ
jgi:hypothetical protein